MFSLHLFIFGRVQDVSFRISVRREAKSLGLVGFIQNLPDGSIEMIVEGERTGLEHLLNWCHDGPRFALVDHIEEVWSDICKFSYSDFSIHY